MIAKHTPSPHIFFNIVAWKHRLKVFLELPLLGALYVNTLYPGRCPGLWKSCPFGAQWLQVRELLYLFPLACLFPIQILHKRHHPIQLWLLSIKKSVSTSPRLRRREVSGTLLTLLAFLCLL